MHLRWNRRLIRWTGEVKPTLKLALPIVAGLVGQMIMGLADTMMVGRVGVVPLAAASLVNTVAHLPLVFAYGLLSAIAVLAAHAFGARQPREAGEVLRHGLAAGIGIGLISAVGLALFRPHLARLGQPPEVVAASGIYLYLFGFSLLPALVAHAGKQFSEAMNHPWPPTLILLGGILLNIFLNWVFIYGNLGVPALGLEGAGVATLLARTAQMVGVLFYILRAPALRAFHPVRWWTSLGAGRMRRLLGIGLPVGAQHLLEVGAFVFTALMMGWISAEAIAAHQIAISCAATTFMFSLGIGMAVCIRVGHAWGARRFPRMRRIGFVGLTMAIAISGSWGLVFILAGEPIARLFIASPEVVTLAAQMLFVAALFQVADGTQVVALSALRGLADVRAPALLAALAYWLIAIPLGYLLAFPWDRGAVGLWVGMAIGLFVAALSLSWRFHRKSHVAQQKLLPQVEPSVNPTQESSLGAVG